MKNIDDFKLTNDVTVKETRQWITLKDDTSKKKLIDFIKHRFTNRYLKHLDIDILDSGFFKMAICCLMIETLESFKQGEEDTKGKSKQIFIDFFETEQTSFPKFKNISTDFYYSIRCGILHQAETTNAWRILRVGDLLDKSERTINADKFVESLNKSLITYIQNLEENDINEAGGIWSKAILKINHICKNCQVNSEI
jgi:hypothetical protein